MLLQETRRFADNRLPWNRTDINKKGKDLENGPAGNPGSFDFRFALAGT